LTGGARRLFRPAPLRYPAAPMPSLSDLRERSNLVQQRLAQLKEGL
jgi:hypothetical protein